MLLALLQTFWIALYRRWHIAELDKTYLKEMQKDQTISVVSEAVRVDSKPATGQADCGLEIRSTWNWLQWRDITNKWWPTIPFKIRDSCVSAMLQTRLCNLQLHFQPEVLGEHCLSASEPIIWCDVIKIKIDRTRGFKRYTFCRFAYFSSDVRSKKKLSLKNFYQSMLWVWCLF